MIDHSHISLIEVKLSAFIRMSCENLEVLQGGAINDFIRYHRT